MKVKIVIRDSKKNHVSMKLIGPLAARRALMEELWAGSGRNASQVLLWFDDAPGIVKEIYSVADEVGRRLGVPFDVEIDYRVSTGGLKRTTASKRRTSKKRRSSRRR